MPDFKQWMQDNAEHFKTYSDSEIADVAVAAGFDRKLVVQWITSEKFRSL